MSMLTADTADKLLAMREEISGVKMHRPPTPAAMQAMRQLAYHAELGTCARTDCNRTATVEVAVGEDWDVSELLCQPHADEV